MAAASICNEAPVRVGVLRYRRAARFFGGMIGSNK
jgi:hypothetical protein